MYTRANMCGGHSHLVMLMMGSLQICLVAKRRPVLTEKTESQPRASTASTSSNSGSTCRERCGKRCGKRCEEVGGQGGLRESVRPVCGRGGGETTPTHPPAHTSIHTKWHRLSFSHSCSNVPVTTSYPRMRLSYDDEKSFFHASTNRT